MTGTPQLRARVRARLERAAREGARRTVLQVLDAAASSLAWLVLLPATLILHLAGYRRLTVLASRIGHLAAEPDSFLKARVLGQVPDGRYFLVAPTGAAANETLLAYWSALIPTVRGRAAGWLLLAMSRWGLMRHDMSRYILRIGASQKVYRINADWRGRPPLLAVSQDDREWARARFLELGLPAGAWFACVHVREPGFSPADDAAHAHRNADPRAVRAAMEEIVRRGGWCVRMGDPSTTPLAPMAGAIDYAHHPLRSERLDVMLCAHARFFLGNTSGLALVGSAFGVPSALANMIPLSVLGILPADVSIPKLLRSARTGRLLTFAEIFASPAADFRYARLYADAGLEAVENMAEEILELVREVLDRIALSWTPAAEDEALQRRFMALMRPGHYSHGAASRVGAHFLRRHRDLLPPG